jgi:prepilin-type N-terminal cleavage/methylation domain-containing protein
MRRLSGEQGFTLVELLVAMSLMVMVLGATLTTFTNFGNANRRNQSLNDAQDRARVAGDRLARELRNLSSPTNELPAAVEKATPYDLMFLTVDAAKPSGSLNDFNSRRVRYCLNTSSPTDERLWVQTQTWTTAAAPAAPSTTSCPDSAWPTQQIAADKIVNRIGGQDRPVFFYTMVGSDLTTVSAIRTELFVDVDPGQAPAEARLSSGVHLRNQNRKPTASFTSTVNGSTVTLNGSASEDPEGDSLRYAWFNGSTKVGSGVIFSYLVPGSGTRTVSLTLKVYDGPGLEGVAGPQAVTVL